MTNVSLTFWTLHLSIIHANVIWIIPRQDSCPRPWTQAQPFVVLIHDIEFHKLHSLV